jgi:hypothetical protein
VRCRCNSCRVNHFLVLFTMTVDAFTAKSVILDERVQVPIGPPSTTDSDQCTAQVRIKELRLLFAALRVDSRRLKKGVMFDLVIDGPWKLRKLDNPLRVPFVTNHFTRGKRYCDCAISRCFSTRLKKPVLQRENGLDRYLMYNVIGIIWFGQAVYPFQPRFPHGKI